MKTEKEILIDKIVETENRILNVAQNRPGASWLKLDLSMGQLKALFALHQHGAMVVGQLAEMLGVGLSAASILVDKLVQHSLVERGEDPEDRRRTVVRLSTEGDRLISQVRHGSQRVFRECCAQLNTADLKALAQGLDALSRVICARAGTGIDANSTR